MKKRELSVFIFKLSILAILYIVLGEVMSLTPLLDYSYNKVEYKTLIIWPMVIYLFKISIDKLLMLAITLFMIYYILILLFRWEDQIVLGFITYIILVVVSINLYKNLRCPN